MKYVAIVSARMGSDRFPGKVMAKLWNEKTALQVLIQRLRLCKKIDQILVVTTMEDNNVPIFNLCNSMNIKFMYGHKDEVLASFSYISKCIWTYIKEELAIIDITGDCPFIDPFQIDEMIDEFKNESYHYLSNCMIRSFPIGFDIQIYRDYLIDMINNTVVNKVHRTHSGWNIWTYSNILQKEYLNIYNKSLKFGNICSDEKYCFPDWRIVLDYPEDLELLKIIINHFNRIDFTYQDIIEFLKSNPGLLNINKMCRQKNASIEK